MAGPSKNSRTVSLNASKQFQLAAETRLIIPCNKGQHAYVIDIRNGKNAHVSTRSEQFVDAIKTNVEAGHSERVRNELVKLTKEYPDHGWEKTLASLDEANVFNAAPAE